MIRFGSRGRCPFFEPSSDAGAPPSLSQLSSAWALLLGRFGCFAGMIAICIESQGVTRPMQITLQFIGPLPIMLHDPSGISTPRCPAIRTTLRCFMARREQEESEQGYELLTIQCRMARAALAWGMRDLAGAAHVSADTVARFERGDTLRRSTVRAIRTALEGAGCEFIREDDVSGPGMRMRKRQVKFGG
jgi:hypothetical protein